MAFAGHGQTRTAVVKLNGGLLTPRRRTRRIPSTNRVARFFGVDARLVRRRGQVGADHGL